MDVAETASQALRLGFYPVLVTRGTKRAFHNDWQLREYTQDTLDPDFTWPNAAIGLQWAKGHVDIDIEDVNPYTSRCADVLLPDTPMMWGRTGHERAHRVYTVNEVGHKSQKVRAPNKQGLIELRGEKAQSVIPPSPWYDKSIEAVNGQYTWWGETPLSAMDNADLVIPTVDLAEMEVWCKETAFAAVMAGLWITMEGNRHDAMIGLCGMLLKGGRTVDRVTLIARCIVEYGQDPDPGDRMQIPRTSAARLATGEEVAGYTMFEAAVGPEIAKWAAGLFHLPVERITTVGGITLNDQGNSEVFTSLFGTDLVYLPMKKDWGGWIGPVWNIEGGAFLEQTRAKLVVKHLEALAPTMGTATERMALRSHAMRSGSANAIAAMVKLARDEMVMSESKLDADPALFNVGNGTIELRTGTLREHRREDFITKMGGVEYDGKGECPLWLRFLETTFEGDALLIEFVQRMCGYMLTGLTNEQVIFFLFGNGANGKSTFLEVLTALWGQYALRSPVETVMYKKGDVGIPNDVARLRGARLVITQEIGANMRFSENMIKDLSGDDTKTARFLHGEWFDFKPELKLVLYGNHKPIIMGTDNGIWRRIRLIPFMHTVTDDEKIPDLARILVRDEGPAILRWCVEGCLKWQIARLGNPPAVEEATAEYRGEMDIFGEFFREYFEVTGKPADKVKMGAAYNAYQSWCNETGERMTTQRQFNIKMIESGAEKAKANGEWILRHVKMIRQAAMI